MKRRIFPLLVLTSAACASVAVVACGGSNGNLFAGVDDAGGEAAASSSGASGGTSGTTSGGTSSGTTSGGTSGTTSGGVRDAGARPDAAPRGDAATSPDGALNGDAAAAGDGAVSCGAATCSVSTQTCCVQDAGASCIPNGTTCPGAVAILRCEKAADCPNQDVCCFESNGGPIVASCRQDCNGGDRVQACKTQAECQGGTCTVHTCTFGGSVETCDPIANVCP